MSKGSIVLVTGAAGFVGSALLMRMLAEGLSPRAVTRRLELPFPVGVQTTLGGELGSNFDWRPAMEGCNAVIHAAARVHVMHENEPNPLDSFRLVNVAGTERLARAAVDAGVKRFIYISSIKVNGEGAGRNPTFTEADAPAPQDPYGVSKWEAEQALHRIAKNTDLEIIIVRPPLVYGPGVGGNFIRLLGWVTRGAPLPLAAVRNRRSLVYVGNLVDALITCVTHANAKGNTYLISDGDDVSTAELIRRIAAAVGKQPRLFPMPEAALRMLGKLTGKSAEVSRLVDSLVVNSSKIRTELGWQPPYSLDDGLRATVDWYRQYRNTSQ